MMIVSAPFDPITFDELKEIKRRRKISGVRDIYVTIAGDGILNEEERFSLLERTLKPYRHIHVLKTPEQGVMLDSSKEEEVRKGYFRYAAPGIRNILIQKGYYLQEIASAQCNPHRAIHSKGVADTCVELAHAHYLDERQAYQAGFLHDITKNMSDEEGKQLITLYKPEWLNISSKVWHSYTAVIWLKQNMYFYDAKILRAIEHHTLGDGKSNLDYILYIADKTEPNRNYDSSKERSLAKVNLKAGANLIREESKKYIYETEGIHV